MEKKGSRRECQQLSIYLVFFTDVDTWNLNATLYLAIKDFILKVEIYKLCGLKSINYLRIPNK